MVAALPAESISWRPNDSLMAPGHSLSCSTGSCRSPFSAWVALFWTASALGLDSRQSAAVPSPTQRCTLAFSSSFSSRFLTVATNNTRDTAEKPVLRISQVAGRSSNLFLSLLSPSSSQPPQLTLVETLSIITFVSFRKSIFYRIKYRINTAHRSAYLLPDSFAQRQHPLASSRLGRFIWAIYSSTDSTTRPSHFEPRRENTKERHNPPP